MTGENRRCLTRKDLTRDQLKIVDVIEKIKRETSAAINSISPYIDEIAEKISQLSSLSLEEQLSFNRGIASLLGDSLKLSQDFSHQLTELRTIFEQEKDEKFAVVFSKQILLILDYFQDIFGLQHKLQKLNQDIEKKNQENSVIGDGFIPKQPTKQRLNWLMKRVKKIRKPVENVAAKIDRRLGISKEEKAFQRHNEHAQETLKKLFSWNGMSKIRSEASLRDVVAELREKGQLSPEARVDAMVLFTALNSLRAANGQEVFACSDYFTTNDDSQKKTVALRANQLETWLNHATRNQEKTNFLTYFEDYKNYYQDFFTRGSFLVAENKQLHEENKQEEAVDDGTGGEQKDAAASKNKVTPIEDTQPTAVIDVAASEASPAAATQQAQGESVPQEARKALTLASLNDLFNK